MDMGSRTYSVDLSSDDLAVVLESLGESITLHSGNGTEASEDGKFNQVREVIISQTGGDFEE
jgi:hypothetical protein